MADSAAVNKKKLLRHAVGGLRADVRGGVVVIFAITLPMLLLVVGMAVDYGFMSVRKADLQAAADAAALAGARELQIANADESTAQAVAQSVAMANLTGNSGGITMNTKVSSDPLTVAVEITQSPGLVFVGGMIGASDVDIKVHATARVVGDMPICALTLEDKDKHALSVNTNARITGNGCAIYSNSTHKDGIRTRNGAYMEADLICSAGGFNGDSDTFKPQPLTDCPVFEDPLAARPAPPVGACITTDLEIESGKVSLKPGTYCDDLEISNADVMLEPGIYVIKDGKLKISGTARVYGENVGFYLLGDDATFKMGPNTEIELSAPKDGPMAGILFFEDRKADKGRKHTIRSNNARSLIGTFYLSRGALVIDATKPVFDKSAYTVIIAHTLDMFSGPNLVLNADYGGTDIPVPPGLGGAAGKSIVLSE